MCVYWNTLDVYNDYGGTHVFNHIYIKVGINNRFDGDLVKKYETF
jgi:hypothetical protein